ncbi:MAG: hypothetical protein ABL984_17345 [Pyrinomonadaceae bacterium]
MRTYTFWLKAAAIVQLITAAIHSVSFFVEPEGTNDTERQLFSLMDGYKFDMGAGIHRPFGDLLTGLSMYMTLLYLLGGVLIFYLLRSRVDTAVMRGVTNIFLLIFGFAFAWMVFYTFLPPIVLTGVVFALLFAARVVGFGTQAKTD